MAELNLMYCKKEEEILPRVELEICKYISDNKDEIYDDVLASENRWEIFYHLSEMRTSILNWYDFDYNSSILEVGGGFGAITGMLCSRVKNVTVVEKSALKAEAISKRYRNRDNLVVYAGEITEIDFLDQFDYVVIEGSVCKGDDETLPEKQFEQYVCMSKYWLRETGILLLAVENLNGAKYQCGYPKPILGSINENGCEAMVTKEQLDKIIKKAGFECSKFYYPFPDYRFPQEIYTDAKLPGKNMKNRILNYYVLSGMLFRDEYEFYEDEMDKGGDIRKICNSYLVECGRKYQCSDTEYVAVSTDRGRLHSFATIIGKDKVVKKPIYDEGKIYLKKSYDNILKMQSRGLHIVTHTYENDQLIMPVVKRPKLIDTLFQLAVDEKEMFIKAIDKIYECILNSSDKTERDGEIYLESGYIDMIPLNCFVDQDEYFFFDQEFCEEQCLAGYIMFRVLRYIYLTYPKLDRYVRLENMKRRYGLCNNWDTYLLKEDKFIWNNRQHRINHSFYDWIANGKIGKPMASVEDICGLYVSMGFDAQEEDESNVWAWAIKKHAGICIRNFTEGNIRIRVQFMLGPPPGVQRQGIEISGWKEKGDVIYTPAAITRDMEMVAEELLFIGLNTIGNLTKCDNGDLREFAFQLLNPQIILI